MKILIIGRDFIGQDVYPIAGGGEIILRQIFGALAKKGHEIYVITTRLEKMPDYEEIDGLQIYRPFSRGTSLIKGVLFSIKLVPYLRNFLKSHPVDIIFDCAYSCTLPANYTARRKHIPIVTYVTEYFGKTWFQLVNPFKALIYWLIPSITLHFVGQNVICPSNEVGMKLKRHTKAEVTVIPSPLDYYEIGHILRNDATNDLRAELGITDGEQLLSFVGRLSPEKNVDGLIKALGESSINFKLIVVGDGRERAKLENLTKKLNLEREVVFLGQRPHQEALAIMKACDVLILPSKTEVFPTVVLEALALGRPVISTRVGGVVEVESANLHLIDSIEKINEVLPQIKPRPDGNLLERYSLDNICCQFETIFNKLI
jgi:glycosyltransferase involved in cell wall biosynthesis